MKISIITACFRSAGTLRTELERIFNGRNRKVVLEKYALCLI